MAFVVLLNIAVTARIDAFIRAWCVYKRVHTTSAIIDTRAIASFALRVTFKAD